MKNELYNSLAIVALIIAGFALAFGYSTMSDRLDTIDTKVQDLQFSYEEQLGILSASLDISEPVPLFEDTLASGISNSATSFTLVRGTDATGTNLASSTYGFILSEGSSNEEFVLADCTATACTNVVRGYWPLTNATSSALMKTHRRGDTVKITDSPIINQLKRIVNGQENFPNALRFEGALTLDAVATYSSALSFTPGSNQLVSALYADSIANQGAATSSETASGISQLATKLEQASSTDNGVNDPLVLQAKYATSSSNGTVSALHTIISNNAGKLAQNWIDLTEAFTFTNNVTLSAKSLIGCTQTLTDAATTDFNWANCNTAVWNIGGNRTMTFSNVAAGMNVRLILCQDATGSRTVTWPATMRWQFGSAPTLTTTANKCDILSFVTSTSTTSVFGGIAPNF